MIKKTIICLLILMLHQTAGYAQPPLAEISEHYTIIVEGERIPPEDGGAARVVQGVLLLPLKPIADHLGQKYEYDARERFLTLKRVQDGAVLGISFNNGQVFAGKRLVGYAPYMTLADPEKLILPEEALKALTGVHVTRDDALKKIIIELDARLKPVYDYQLVINGRRLPYTEPFPRSVGAVLLLPLKPVVEELGHRMSLDMSGYIVTVIRTQDNVKLTLDMRTGLMTYNGHPIGLSPNMGYADPVNLLLPSGAVETLTGTNITVPLGEDTVVIETDQRLETMIRPWGRVMDEAAKTEFTPERLQYRIGKDTTNTAAFFSRYREFNTRFRYDTPDLPVRKDSEPSWVSLEIDSLANYGGSIGDYHAQRDQMSGVGVSRIRGGSFYNKMEHGGRFTAAAGGVLTGSRYPDDDYAVPEFGGWAGGVRYYNTDDLRDRKKNQWNAGLDARGSDKGNNRAVVAGYTGQQMFETDLWKQGFIYERLETGVFDTNQEEDGVDWRGSVSIRTSPFDKMSFYSDLRYTGLNFRRSIESIPGDGQLKVSDTDLFSLNPGLTLRPFDWMGAAVRYNWQRTRVFHGHEDGAGDTSGWGVNLNTRPFPKWPWLMLDYSESETNHKSTLYEDGRDWQFRGTLSHQTGFYRSMLRYDKRKDLTESHTLLFTLHPFKLPLPQYGSFTIGPGVSGFKRGNHESVHPNITADFFSGAILGRRTLLNVSYSYSKTYTFDPADDEIKDQTAYQALSDITSDDDTKTYSQFFRAALTHRFSKALELNVGYSTSFQGNDFWYWSLSGILDFNQPRKYTKPLKETGVLTGTVYWDRNQDGIRQEDEQGLGRVPIQVKRTPMRLLSDSAGEFTIQNIRTGSYELMVSTRSLPIGFLPPEQIPMIRVDEDSISRIEIPIIQSGQIRGFVYEDLNQNGEYDDGEPYIEKVRIRVEPEINSLVFSTSFGQFGIDNLEIGAYTLTLDPETIPAHLIPPDPIVILITPANGGMMHKISIGLSE